MKDGFGGWVWLVAAVLFLVADLGFWNWGISWYTVLFAVWGLMGVMGKK